jgi:prepilin-type N-terminal cleavage/methylation domain-containing protein
MRKETPCVSVQRLPHLRGMTLIEMIGVLAILSILAAVILPALIKETDKAVADQETASLQSFGGALQRNITRNRRIPSGGGFDWATNIAAELGVDIGSVTNNLRKQPRVFLTDPTGFGSLTLPYTQNTTGTPLPPNPRVMIVSSLGRALPVGLVSGGSLSSSDFTNLWNCAVGFVPTDGLWTGWPGNPNDVMVQRVNLTPLFVFLLLSTNYSNWGCAYSMDTSAMVDIIATTGVSNYFLQNTILNLYYTNVTQANSGWVLDSSQILDRDSSFVFYANEWRRSIGTNALGVFAGGGGGGGGIGTNGVGNYDFSGVINGFLSANPTTLTRSQQTNLVQSFITYMNAYNAWAASNFADDNLGNTASIAQNAMKNYLEALMTAVGNQVTYQVH